jgi:hypothetical protein
MAAKSLLVALSVVVAMSMPLLAQEKIAAPAAPKAEQAVTASAPAAKAAEKPAAALPAGRATVEPPKTAVQTKPSAEKPAIEDVAEAIDAALDALKADRKELAMAKLAEAKEMLARMTGLAQKKAEKAEAPAPAEKKAEKAGVMMGVSVVNTVCPITGDKLTDPTFVPDKLVREFKGQKIGFCCDDCPIKWDKMTAEQKQAELDKVMKASVAAKRAEPKATEPAE